MSERFAASSSWRMTTALVTEMMLDSLRLMVTLTVALAIASAVRFVNAFSSPVMVVEKISSGCSEALGGSTGR